MNSRVTLQGLLHAAQHLLACKNNYITIRNGRCLQLLLGGAGCLSIGVEGKLMLNKRVWPLYLVI